ncbi:MoxR family ATPase [Desulfovibrio sp. UCD-KL4C]|uniref:AAA family ATPase n=1 Tax=Desulfovibrio sp. UCD-KL4C TaxID=2578120 RepID=UPI0025C599C6|nr:MoxR family ATPase [Desulfovibrio sp. UCD-KL4C]
MDYFWDEKHKFAIKAAIKAKRPLLVRGEPGVGKSTLAKAAAFNLLNRYYISETVTASTEANDLLWQFDAVQRLGDAQVSKSDSTITLDKEKYIAPGILWWAYQPEEALKRYGDCSGGCSPSIKIMEELRIGNENSKSDSGTRTNGWVVLIDEIDKADANVPNSLLEAFAENGFTVPYLKNAVELDTDLGQPLIIITTNEDRQLPPAFLRRCFVLHMEIPDESDEAVKWLLDRAGACSDIDVDPKTLQYLAVKVVDDRERSSGPHRPGLSEFLDLARVFSLSPKISSAELGESFSFVLQKNAR